MQLLLEHKIDINMKSSCEKIALHMIAKNRYEAIVWLLLKNSANVNSKNKYGLISLISVVENNYKIVI